MHVIVKRRPPPHPGATVVFKMINLNGLDQVNPTPHDLRHAQYTSFYAYLFRDGWMDGWMDRCTHLIVETFEWVALSRGSNINPNPLCIGLIQSKSNEVNFDPI